MGQPKCPAHSFWASCHSLPVKPELPPFQNPAHPPPPPSSSLWVQPSCWDVTHRRSISPILHLPISSHAGPAPAPEESHLISITLNEQRKSGYFHHPSIFLAQKKPLTLLEVHWNPRFKTPRSFWIWVQCWIWSEMSNEENKGKSSNLSSYAVFTTKIHVCINFILILLLFFTWKRCKNLIKTHPSRTAAYKQPSHYFS